MNSFNRNLRIADNRATWGNFCVPNGTQARLELTRQSLWFGRNDAQMNPHMRSGVRRKRSVARRRLVLLALCALLALLPVYLRNRNFVGASRKLSPASPGTVLVFFSTRAQNDLVDAIFKTWGRELLTLGYSCADGPTHPMVTQLAEIVCDEYPPINTWRVVLSYVIRTEVHWYLKVDDDTFVNSKNLLNFIDGLEHAQVSGVKHLVYTGAIGRGRVHERTEIGLNGSNYVMGGPGVLISRKLLELLQPILPTCMSQIYGTARHSDTQLTFCVRMVRSIPAYESDYREVNCGQMFLHHQTNLPLTSSGNFSASTVLLDEIAYNTAKYSHTVTHHSVKNPRLMTDLHGMLAVKAKRCDENPIYVAKKGCLNSCKCLPPSSGTCHSHCCIEKPLLGSACDHNVDGKRFRLQRPPAYVLTLKPHLISELLISLKTHFHVVHVFDDVHTEHAEEETTLSAGEVAYRNKMRRIMLDAIQRGYETVAIFDDDVLFHHDYATMLNTLLQHAPCACILSSRSKCPPGVLKLGNTAWGGGYNTEWAKYEHNFTGYPCTSFNDVDLGSYAAIYNVDIFHYITTWLDWEQNLPFDWVFAWLAEMNVPVKAAFPFLNIADVSHPSSVRKRDKVNSMEEYLSMRAARHGWDMTMYT